METPQKNRLLFWLLIFLILVNLSALSTYLFIRQADPQAESCEKGNDGKMWQDELNLSDVQAAEVKAINARHRDIAEPVAAEIRNNRALILEELEHATPDTIKLDSLVKMLTGLQNQLQKANIRQFLELKTVVNADQALKLSSLYREAYGCPMKQGNDKGGNQHRHGKGRRGCESNQ